MTDDPSQNNGTNPDTQPDLEEHQTELEENQTELEQVDSSIKTRTYVVFPGDTIHSIAARQLGSSDRWREIYELNLRAIGPDLNRGLKVGTPLRLPVTEQD